MVETRAELPFIGDQVGLLKPRPALVRLSPTGHPATKQPLLAQGAARFSRDQSIERDDAQRMIFDT